MPLSFKDVQATESPNFVDVYVAKWNGEVRLRRITAAKGIAIGRQIADLPKRDDGQPTDDSLVELYVLTIVASAVNDDGTPMFPDEASIEFLRREDMSVVNTLGTAAIRLNGMGGDIEKKSPPPRS